MNTDPEQTAVDTRTTERFNVERRDEQQFQKEIDSLIRESEDTRLKYMQKHRSREFMGASFGLLLILAGSGGFGWFLLVKANLVMAVLCIFAAIAPSIFFYLWAGAALKAYVQDHKTNFMPKMAKALGGLKFHPSRGISSKIISKTGVIQSHDKYVAEDCFMGTYKGVKVIFSEARLYTKKKPGDPIFDGIFVLLEIPDKAIEGHTIITANDEMAKKWGPTRWKKLQSVPAETDNPEWNRFHIFTDSPEAAGLLVGEKLLKELAEASDVFKQSPLTAVLFKGKYIFLSIPYDEDMFEASSIYVPVTTKQCALNCKKEIDQILEVIDVFELYKPAKSSQDFAT